MYTTCAARIHMDQQLELQFGVTKKRMTVRELLSSKQDFEILKLAQEFANDVDLNEEIEDDILLMSCIRVRNDPERGNVNVFIAYDGDDAVGFLVGVTSGAFHRRAVVAEQKLCYVTKSARGSLAVKLLIKAYERWARLNGATQIFTGTANKRYAERTSKLLEHLGYARVGAMHVKEI